MNNPCIYIYTNTINDLKYVGQTKISFQKRDYDHLKARGKKTAYGYHWKYV